MSLQVLVEDIHVDLNNILQKRKNEINMIVFLLSMILFLYQGVKHLCG